MPQANSPIVNPAFCSSRCVFHDCQRWDRRFLLRRGSSRRQLEWKINLQQFDACLHELTLIE
jgi:hypothetical protein